MFSIFGNKEFSLGTPHFYQDRQKPGVGGAEHALEEVWKAKTSARDAVDAAYLAKSKKPERPEFTLSHMLCDGNPLAFTLASPWPIH